MTRKTFILTPPYREITNSDTTKPFTNQLFPQGNILSSFLRDNTDNTHIFVFDQDDEIKALMMFDDNETYFHVEFLLANALHPHQKAGTKLLLLLEGLATTLNYDRIELWSLSGMIQYYSALGYTNTGLSDVGRYGEMYKMVKSLR
jgi:histone acetyltransferase (RNA polymerase elongator complex component)